MKNISDWSLKMHKKVKILDKVNETKKITTYRFKDDMCVKPGQFVMIWLPGNDEIPMSISYTGVKKGITVNNIGDATKTLCSLKKGDYLALRGPYGTSFNFGRAKRVLAVGGGVGMAPLAPAIEVAVDAGIKVITTIGARTKDDLLFTKRMQKVSEVQIATDDGSEGHHGYISDIARMIIQESKKDKKKKIDLIITCGPEIMMRKIFECAVKNGIPAQASVERHMKCAVGICDSCSIDGLLVCKDGPIFSAKQLEGTDFGKCWRDTCGRRIPIR
jgi:dihydroorotate dehydrogenase electron transfer subunit